MDTQMWRLMLDDEIGFLVKTATAEQAKAIVTQRFQVNANEIRSVKPDGPAPSNKPEPPDIEKSFNLDKDRFSKPKPSYDKPNYDKPSYDKPGFPTLDKRDEDNWKEKQSQGKRW